MTCPSRKNLMICKIVQNKKNKKEKNIKEKEITEEKHKERLKKLKDMGIIK